MRTNRGSTVCCPLDCVLSMGIGQYLFCSQTVYDLIFFTVYVETAREKNAATVTVKIGTDSYNRSWRIKVSYIGCFSVMRAPLDCQQYFTGLTGAFESYSFAAGETATVNQEYTNCFRLVIYF